MPVLTGVAHGVCERRYGGRPIRGAQGPEAGLRILIAYLVREAQRRSIGLSPLLGYVHDHYVRTFLRAGPPTPGLGESPLIGDPTALGDAAPRLAGVGPFGPMWLGPLFDPVLVAHLEIPPTAERPEELGRFIERVQEESAADRPFYYEPNALASELGLSEPPGLVPLLAALRSSGFQAARSHVRPSAFRTTAPRSLVYSTVRGLRASH
jgi:tRNA (guanine26-N2/guanine27-N2)-dimethyltransferase